LGYDLANLVKAMQLISLWRTLKVGAEPCQTSIGHNAPLSKVPGKVSGAWVFRGTRMPVQTVFENLEAGLSIEEITEVFDVSPEEVRASEHG
jgi:uncharacterized protein (DUF433 family)